MGVPAPEPGLRHTPLPGVGEQGGVPNPAALGDGHSSDRSVRVAHWSASIVNKTRGRGPRQVSTGSVSPWLVSPDFSSTRTDARFSGSAVAHIEALCSTEKPKSSKSRVASVA